MIKATLLLKRRARVAKLGRQAIQDGYFHKVIQCHYLLNRIDAEILSITSQKPIVCR